MGLLAQPNSFGINSALGDIWFLWIEVFQLEQESTLRTGC